MADLFALKERLKKNYRDFTDDYQRSVEASYKKQLAKLRPGETAPTVKRLVGDDRKAFEERVKKYRHENEQIVKDAENSIAGALSAAPSTEAVNFVSMLNLRNDLTQSDIDAAIAKYGNNYSAYAAIASIGQRQPNKLYTAPHEVDNMRNFIEMAKPISASMTLIGAENSAPTRGRAAFIDMSLDGEL